MRFLVSFFLAVKKTAVLSSFLKMKVYYGFIAEVLKLKYKKLRNYLHFLWRIFAGISVFWHVLDVPETKIWIVFKHFIGHVCLQLHLLQIISRFGFHLLFDMFDIDSTILFCSLLLFLSWSETMLEILLNYLSAFLVSLPMWSFLYQNLMKFYYRW